MKKIYIPENGNGLDEGYYTIDEIVDLLKDNCDNATRVFYIADRIETARAWPESTYE
jgi:hypothetical protein